MVCLRERIKASTDAAELHGMIAGWQSTRLPERAGRRCAAVKPNVVSADVLFEEFRGHLKWVGRRSGPRSGALTRWRRSARSGADLVGYLNYIHPYRAQILGEREINYLSNATSRGLPTPYCAHRDPGAAGAGAGRRPDRPRRAAFHVSAPRFRCSPRPSHRPS